MQKKTYTKAQTEYWKKLQHPKWQELRLKAFSRSCFKCDSCDNNEITLHAHHRYYVKGREPWEYPLWAIQSLCDDCHDFEHTPCHGPDDENPVTEWEIVMGWIYSHGGPDELWFLMADLTQIIGDIETHGKTKKEAMNMLQNAIRSVVIK